VRAGFICAPVAGAAARTNRGIVIKIATASMTLGRTDPIAVSLQKRMSKSSDNEELVKTDTYDVKRISIIAMLPVIKTYMLVAGRS